MDNKKQVLLITNAMSDEEVSLIKHAFNQSHDKCMGINLSLVHIIPRLPTCYFNIPSMSVLIEKYHTNARQVLDAIGNQLNVAAQNRWLIAGNIRTEALRLATTLDATFVLVSMHQIQHLQRSLLFINLNHYFKQSNVKQLENFTT